MNPKTDFVGKKKKNQASRNTMNIEKVLETYTESI